MSYPSTSESVPKDAKSYKIIVIGDSSVGKTCLTYRFCEGIFLEGAECTIGVDYRERTLKIGDDDIKLQLWDTAGQERFRKSMVAHYYRHVDAVVLVYDVSSVATFNSLKQWISECVSNDLYDAPKILIGNKCDVEPEVSEYDAQVFADKNNMPFFRTSAKMDCERENIESIFLTVAHKLKNKKSLKLNSVCIKNTIPDSTPKKTGGCC